MAASKADIGDEKYWKEDCREKVAEWEKRVGSTAKNTISRTLSS